MVTNKLPHQLPHQ